MRDRWYGDHRDLVKWGSLVNLAQTQGLDTVLQVAFYRPDDTALCLESGGGRVPLPLPVLSHFRDLERIEGLAQATGLRIEVFKEPFLITRKGAQRHNARQEYVDKLQDAIRALGHRRLVVFLDPDTGIAPGSTAQPQHVLPSEVKAIFGIIKPTDWLVLYQHARRSKGWQKTTRSGFASALGIEETLVSTYSCSELAKDVVLFAAEKPRNRGKQNA